MKRMKKYFLIFALMLMAMGLSFTVVSCSSDDNENNSLVIEKENIVGTWELKGWGNDILFTTYTNGYLTFSSDGTLTAKGKRNQIYGHYVCQGDKIEMDYATTKIGYTNEEDYFFEENLRNVTKYSFTKKGNLRLYYSIDEYFELTLIQS